jgi:DNA-binding HxlR family transcriptional regulator
MVQAKGLENIFNKIISEYFPNLEEEMVVHVQEASRSPIRNDQKITSPCYIIIKMLDTENKESHKKKIANPLKRQTHHYNSRFLSRNLKRV